MLRDSTWPLCLLLLFALHFARCALAQAARRPSRSLQVDADEFRDFGAFGRWFRSVGARALEPPLRWVVAAGVEPNRLTVGCLLLCAAGGACIALGAVALGGVLGLLGCSLDYFDGRVARLSRRATRAGAFLDGTLDRCGEFALLGGAALRLHQTRWAVAACLLALCAGGLVSYARAKGEALGVSLREGAMQRPERVLLFCLGACASTALDASLPQALQGQHHVLGWTITVLAILTSHSAWLRIWRGFGELQRAEAAYTEDPLPMTHAEETPELEGRVAK